ncbi:TIGR03862 family flavoprotein [Acinetobacter ursingii]|uniref:TIGR03862 family flavoprotein n=1 Tax=Acinetobacter ursingii TaxID=108980 RepID=UPI00124D64AE|nr:TIGR03862 family flavoprotein [Acinetobacter ursingii]MDG9858896.1 TIGR03862 family flavoprotein [Acinetobacter ursingii]MDG9892413.1 TIGR03862 family flavoprotein [Acinetobacter ursingii]MDH0006126.1 TIGR03862 family flavoprotein [Acinetobacter ursingii]MDH0477664.1 TIGR03862 family flavoprotein [Acinetobacter ursingii]MDH2118503.1 TIGR03862 family flavoprotein [Acinetobacter ursingii]
MPSKRVVIVGAGPAGLACAEVLSELGDYNITIYEQKPSAARKFLMAGKTGLNISHAEDLDHFISRYDHANWLRPMLETCNAETIQAWMKGLGIESYIGSSGRIFPNEMKAAPLLRAWLRRLQDRGVKFRYRHQVLAIQNQSLTVLDLVQQQQNHITADAIVLACGAVSWPQLGSDGKWQNWLESCMIQPFSASNVGVLVNWSEYLQPIFGQPLKRIQAWVAGQVPQFGEMVISHYGLEGGLVYRCNRDLREAMQTQSHAILYLDLLPDLSQEQILQKLQQGKKQSLNTLWQKIGLDKTKIALIRDVVSKNDWNDAIKMAQHIKQIAVQIQGFRPIEEAISCAGGIRLDALNKHLMLKNSLYIFACGEMLDWDAPTGGYLLTACLATGRQAGVGIHQMFNATEKS